MVRVHRSLRRLMNKVDPTKVADQAEYYVESLRAYKRELQGVSGLASVKKVKALIKKIDSLEREIVRQEDKLDKLAERRALAAAQLYDEILLSQEIAEEYLEPDEFRDFRG